MHTKTAWRRRPDGTWERYRHWFFDTPLIWLCLAVALAATVVLLIYYPPFS